MYFLYALLVAFIVYIVGSIFDKSRDNRYAGLAALLAFLLVLLGLAG